MDTPMQSAEESQATGSGQTAQKRPAPEGTSATQPGTLAIVPAKRQKTDGPDGSQIVIQATRPIDYVEKSRFLLDLEINPAYLDRLKQSNTLGFTLPTGSRPLDATHIELDVKEFRKAVKHVMKSFLIRMFLEQNRLSNLEIQAEISTLVPLIVDSTMNAVYARLRAIHKQEGEHATRFNAPPTYTKDIELPLPIADAVQQLGPFEVKDVKKKYLIYPVYPANTLNEGRKRQVYSSRKYVSITSTLKELKIPMKSVVTQARSGSAWWTYKVVQNCGLQDLVCTLPPCHYTMHSANLRGVFLSDSNPVKDYQIINLSKLTDDYGTMLRECGNGYNVRAMSALCHTRDEDYNRDKDN
uniref:Coat protein 2 n=1 Tax=Conifer deltapartitivirus TaxID=2933097 RepID=A0A9C7GWH5_9VIRU|nr:putative coat protein 2 [Conifer deltapartitivirus]CAI5383871.1 putative coat protein 2 [Conifer deltapartitivirus]